MPELTAVEDENLDDVEETVFERIYGLGEMFPDGLRNAVSTTTGYTVSGTKWMFNFSGKAIWIAATSFMILALPVVFEVERVQTQEAELAQQRQILLGPNASGGGYPGSPQPQMRR